MGYALADTDLGRKKGLVWAGGWALCCNLRCPSGIQCWDVETWHESGAELHPALQLSLGSPLTLSAAQCCGLAPALCPRHGLLHLKRSSMRGLNTWKELNSWKNCEWICECQHSDQTYLKEMVGNEMQRKGGGCGMKLICELSPWARSAL